jgi:DNA-binding LytR/AlgR family response regulator
VDRLALKDSLRGWAQDLGFATALGLFVGLIGPFGSYFNGPLWQRAAFQVACFWLGTLMFGGAARLILRLRLQPAPTWIAIVAAVVVLMWPFSVAASLIARAFWPFIVKHVTPLDWYLQGLVTATPVVIALSVLIRHRARQDRLRREAGGATPSPEGLLGYPSSQVLCLQMEDHYVRVHVRGGSRLVLATLGQAMAALGPADGLQVHRSWWVARKAVAGAEQHGRNLRLRLVTGAAAPVARSAVPTVRAAGWLDG